MLSFEALSDKSRSIACIMDKKKKKPKRVIYLTEKGRTKVEQAEDFPTDLSKFCDEKLSDGQCLILKDGYEFEFCPPNKLPNMLRANYYINGRSGSGKSWYINELIVKYATMYPENEIYYISCNDINNDVSYSEEMKKRVKQIELTSITSTVDFKKFKSCFFLFDDVLDTDITLDIVEEYQKEITEKKKELTRKQLLTIEKETDGKSAAIKARIVKSIMSLIFLGRKQEISVAVVDHTLFSGKTSSDIIKESDYVTLFPYSNTSKLTLADFLMKKISFDVNQAKEVTENDWKQYDFLTIGNSGKKFYITPDKIKIL